jgi:hypothetical protein
MTDQNHQLKLFNFKLNARSQKVPHRNVHSPDKRY